MKMPAEVLRTILDPVIGIAVLAVIALLSSILLEWLDCKRKRAGPRIIMLTGRPKLPHLQERLSGVGKAGGGKTETGSNAVSSLS